jgi:TRAP-type C4-dicarboxylate transport system permease small subunit
LKTLKRLAILGGRLFGRVINQITLSASAIAGLAVLAMTLIITLDVVMRYAFKPTKWVEEFSTYLMAGLVFLGLAYTLKENAHIRVDFLMVKLPKRVRDWLGVINSILLLAFTLILFFLNWHFFTTSFALKATSRTSMDVILWPAQLVMPVGLAIMSLLLICNIYTQTKAALGKSKQAE